MPSNGAESEAFDVRNEKHFGLTDKGDELILWDLIKGLPPTIATDRICEALNKQGVKAEWTQIYFALTEPMR